MLVSAGFLRPRYLGRPSAMSADRCQERIVAAFNAAARTYDSATPIQREVARTLVARAAPYSSSPANLLDLGAGAGHVTGYALRQWPGAEITALDAAPAMLARLREKFPKVATIERDASCLDGLDGFDLILSSMMLHWLGDPCAALLEWRGHLTLDGSLHVATPIDGSLSEWRALTRQSGIQDGLWSFPPEDFADGLGAEVDIQEFPVLYPDVRAFLKSLKDAGAHSSRPGAMPAAAGALRRLLAEQGGPFRTSFRVAFLRLPAQQKPSRGA